MNADMTNNVTLPLKEGLQCRAWAPSKCRFLFHNGGHLSIEFVDSFQNDKGERPCQHSPPPLKRKRLSREDRNGDAGKREADKGYILHKLKEV